MRREFEVKIYHKGLKSCFNCVAAMTYCETLNEKTGSFVVASTKQQIQTQVESRFEM